MFANVAVSERSRRARVTVLSEPLAATATVARPSTTTRAVRAVRILRRMVSASGDVASAKHEERRGERERGPAAADHQPLDQRPGEARLGEEPVPGLEGGREQVGADRLDP